MSARPDLASMTLAELRGYVLEHRNDEESLHLYLDKLRTENPNSRVYQAEENVGAAIAEYLQNRPIP
jgi:hypothetical protein